MLYPAELQGRAAIVTDQLAGSQLVSQRYFGALGGEIDGESHSITPYDVTFGRYRISSCRKPPLQLNPELNDFFVGV